jgi:hypothetical protein
MHAIEYQIYPGYVTFDVLLPLAVAGWICATWSAEAVERRRSLYMLLATVGVVLVMHANYVFFLGLAVAGYLLLWALAGPWSRQIVRAHATAAIALGAFTALGLGSLVPVYRKLSHFARSAQDDSIQRLFTDDRFEDMLRGTIQHYHLRADYMVTKIGAFAIIGALAIPLLLAVFRRSPGVWIIGGAALSMLTISQSERLFEMLMRVGSTTAGSRLDQAIALYLVMGLAGALLGVAWASDWLWRRGMSGRAVASALVVALGVGAATMAVTWPKRDADMPGMPTVVAMWATIAVTGALLVLAVPAYLRRGSRHADLVTRAGAPISNVGVVMATLLLVVAAGIPVARASQEVVDQAGDRAHRADEADTLDRFKGDVRQAIQKLPPGSVVLGPLEVSYELTSLAPVYVVADHKYWLADTAANHNRERIRLVKQFFASKTNDLDRNDILDGARPIQHGHDVDAIVVGNPSKPWVDAYFMQSGEWNLVAQNDELRVYERRLGRDS